MAVERWLAGEDRHVVGPFLAPADLLPDTGTTLVLLDSDLAALAWAAATGAGLLLRTTARADRNRLLGDVAGASVLVSSVDALHSPILRKEIARSRPGIPWLVWRADRLHSLHREHAGRLPWVVRHRDACRGGGLLWLHADRGLAPQDAEVLEASPGVLRRVARGEAGPLLELARGIAAGPGALGDLLGHQLGEAGRARRSHELAALRRRAWQQADRALRSEGRGVDSFADDPGTVPGRGLLRTAPAWSPAELAVPLGAALGQVDASPGEGAPVTAEVVSRLKRLLEEEGTARWLGVAGDAPGVSAALLGDLASAGMLADLRPTRLSARVADQGRFRPPRVDREPEYRALYDDYKAAMGGLALSERVRFALTDRAPQDLRGLAQRLDRDPASVADLLVTMDDDGLVTAFCEPLGGAADWQATRGPRWEDEAKELASAVEELRAARREPLARAAAILAATEGCRAALLGAALGVKAETCGFCDLCDPTGSRWPETMAAAPPPLRVGPAGGPRRERPTPGLDSLFAGLGGGAGPKAAEAPSWNTDDLAKALATGERLDAALEAAGSVALLWLRGAWQDVTPGRGRRPSAEVADALVSHLAGEAGPSTGRAGGGVRRLPSGVVEVRLRGGGVGTSHRFAERPDTWQLLDAAAALESPPAALAGLAAVRAGRAGWQAWLEATRSSLDGWMTENGGLPEVASHFADAPVVAGESAWSAALSTLDAACRGDLDGALEALPEVPGSDEVEAMLLAALGEWGTLWEAGEEALVAREPSEELVARLERRALLGLDPLPPLDAGVVRAWLAWAASEPGAAELPGTRLVRSVERGRPADFVALARLADEADVAARALKIGQLPEKLVPVALQAHALVDVLAAVADAERRGPALWKRYAASLPLEEQRRLVTTLRERSPGMAAAGEGSLARLEAAAAERQRVLDLAAEGRLVEILPLLVGLEARDPELDAVRAQVDAAQRRYSTPLARALTSDEHDAAAWGALRQARADGWLDAMVLLLRLQVRRYPADGRRVLWLARSLAVAGRWFEAEASFGEAAALAEGQPKALEREFEGVDLALEAGQGRRVGEWLVRLVRSRRTRALAREITTRLWAGKVSPEACEVLEAELLRDGSGLFAGALRALQDRRRR